MTFDPDRLDYSAEELLLDAEVKAPLLAGDVLCHGGFDVGGQYVSPRTLHRSPAILAWQNRLARENTPLIDIADPLLPPQYPSVAQAKLLLQRGFSEPIVRALTVISILEGFGAIIRDVRVPDLGTLFVEPIAGTGLAHLDRGLFEAHARDEAGYRDQGGHKQMWEAARDLALENPKIPSDVFLRLMGERGQSRASEPLFAQLDKRLHRMLGTMCQVYVIEVFARRTFDWGIQLLGDPEVSAAPREASAMVAHIQSDEAPHVEYLRTALSEARARSLRTADGAAISGRQVVDGMLHDILSRMTDSRPREQRDTSRGVLAQAVQAGKITQALVDEFDALAPAYQPPTRTGFEPAQVT